MPLDVQGNISAKRIHLKAFLVVSLVSALIRVSPVSCGVDLYIEDQSTVGEGTNVRMRCNGSDGVTDTTNTRFLRDSRNITISDKYSIRNDHQAPNTVILTIRAVTLADSGTYQCKTSAGGDSNTVLLTVYGDPQFVVPDKVIAYDGRKALVAVQVTFLGIGLHLSVAKEQSIVSTETVIIDKVLNKKYVFTIPDVTPKSTGFYTVQWSHSSKSGNMQFYLLVKERLYPPYKITVSSKGEVKFDYIQQKTDLFDSLAIFLIRFWPNADHMNITNVTVSSDQRSATVHFPEACSVFQLQMWSVGNHTTSNGSEIVNVKAAQDSGEPRFLQANGAVFVKGNGLQLGKLGISDYTSRSDVRAVCSWMLKLPSKQIKKAVYKCYAFPLNLQTTNGLKQLISECVSLNEVKCSEVVLRFSEVCQGYTTPPSSADTGVKLEQVLIPLFAGLIAILFLFIFLWKKKACCFSHTSKFESVQPTMLDLKAYISAQDKRYEGITTVLADLMTKQTQNSQELRADLQTVALSLPTHLKKEIEGLKDEFKPLVRDIFDAQKTLKQKHQAAEVDREQTIRLLENVKESLASVLTEQSKSDDILQTIAATIKRLSYEESPNVWNFESVDFIQLLHVLGQVATSSGTPPTMPNN